MKFIYRLMLAFFILAVPIVAIVAASNAVTRMPDLYQYEFKSIDAASKADLPTDDETLGKLFSDFMRGTAKEFELTVEYRSTEVSAFKIGDSISMNHARNRINSFTWIGAAVLVLGSGCFFVLYRRGSWEALRWGIKCSYLVMLGMWGGFLAFIYLPGGKEYMLDFLFGPALMPDSALLILLTDSFYKLWILASIAGSILVMAVLSWGIRKLTRPRGMFY